MSDRQTAEVDQYPWKTAPEYAEEAMRELDIEEGSPLWDQVIEFSVRYGIEDELEDYSPQPASIAAASIYLVGLLHGQKRNQKPVSDATGVSVQSIRKVYTAIAEAEGYQINTERQRSSGDGDRDGRDGRGDRSRGLSFSDRLRRALHRGWLGNDGDPDR